MGCEKVLEIRKDKGIVQRNAVHGRNVNALCGAAAGKGNCAVQGCCLVWRSCGENCLGSYAAGVYKMLTNVLFSPSEPRKSSLSLTLKVLYVPPVLIQKGMEIPGKAFLPRFFNFKMKKKREMSIASECLIKHFFQCCYCQNEAYAPECTDAFLIGISFALEHFIEMLFVSFLW